MYFDFGNLPSEGKNKLLHSTIVPRPIAWVSTVDEIGRPNLAPFSFFNVFSTDPPILGFGVGQRAPGRSKDTSTNIRATGEFVVNLVSYTVRHEMNITGAEVEEDIDEAKLAGLSTEPSIHVKPQRLKESPVSMECILHQAIELATERFLILGRVLAMHIADENVENAEKFYVATPKLDLIGRMHGMGWYARTDSLFQMKRV